MPPRKQHRRSSGSIRKLPSGRWQARYTGPDGTMRPLGTFATKADADAAIARETTAVHQGDWRRPELGQIPLGDFLRRWIESRADLALGTRSLYRRLLKTWIEAPLPSESMRASMRALASLPVNGVTPADVREWHGAVLRESQRRAHERHARAAASASAVNAAIRRWAVEQGVPIASTGRIRADVRAAWERSSESRRRSTRSSNPNAGHTEAAQAYRVLRAGLAQAVKDGLIRENPCSLPGAGQRDTRNRSERKTVTLEEARTIAAAMPERYRRAVIVAVLSGLRAGELFALQRKHVDFAGGSLRVEQSLGREERDAPTFTSTKTESSKRTVYLPREALAALREQLDEFAPSGREGLVFGTANGTPLRAGSRSKMFRRACAGIGRDDVTWHDLRHSALQMWAAIGATIPELMAIAGHSSSKSAMHYQHVAAGAQQRLAVRLDAMLSEAPVLLELRPELATVIDRLAS